MRELLIQKMAYVLLDHANDAFNAWWDSRGCPDEAEKRALLTTASHTWKVYRRKHAEHLPVRG